MHRIRTQPVMPRYPGPASPARVHACPGIHPHPTLPRKRGRDKGRGDCRVKPGNDDGSVADERPYGLSQRCAARKKQRRVRPGPFFLHRKAGNGAPGGARGLARPSGRALRSARPRRRQVCACLAPTRLFFESRFARPAAEARVPCDRDPAPPGAPSRSPLGWGMLPTPLASAPFAAAPFPENGDVAKGEWNIVLVHWGCQAARHATKRVSSRPKRSGAPGPRNITFILRCYWIPDSCSAASGTTVED
jgi:hypothetical protein